MPAFFKPVKQAGRADERGAALVTMLLVSLLILTAGGTLIVTTSMSATNTVDATSEVQAYYAAEAGNQAVLDIFRGNVAPNPLLATNPAGGIASENKLSFRRAVTVATSNVAGDTATPRLSRWMTYNTNFNPARVTLSPGYTAMNGMAYSATVSDPDNSATVTFSTSGLFSDGTTTKQFVSGGDKVTLRYDAQASTTITTSGASTLGKLTVTEVKNGGYTFTNETFKLTITQTAPWAATYTINCTLSGSVTSTSTSFVTVNFPTSSNNLLGVLYARAGTAINTNGTTSIPVAITAPEPNRVIVNTTGYGPRNAQKRMRMFLSRYAFDITVPSAITLRSADDNTQLIYNAGNSARYIYNGNDHAGGSNVSAFAVTSTVDKTYLDSLSLPSGQVFGSPSGVIKADIASLPTWLQTAAAARAFVVEMRTRANNENRYYTTASPPPDFGSIADPKYTFVDGNVDLPPAGGSGLLIVTGTFTMDGSSDFKGLILVLGGGVLNRNGGGNGDTWGAVMVARFGNTGDFLNPTFNSNGSGTSTIQYDSDWTRNATATPGPRVMAAGEF
ncbi:MAG TPA: pilus assembly PilX N-terminal domain-containing protein [Pyrinomonadaceae bacterium]|jgi:hypothetical protein